MTRLLPLALLPFVASAAVARDEDAASMIEELVLGTTSTTQEALELQTTLSGQAARDREGEDSIGTGIEMELGLTDDIQLGLSLDWSHDDGEHTGAPGVELLGRVWRFDPWELSLGCELSLELLRNGTRESLEGETYLAASLELGGVVLFGNLGLELERERGGEVDARGRVSLAAVGRFEGGLFGTIEAELTTEDGRLRARLAPGLRWQPVAGLELGIAAPIGLTSRDDAIGVVIQLIWSFELDEEEEP